MILRVRELPINLKLLTYPKTTIDFTHCHGLRSEISGVRFPLKVMLDSVFKALLKPARCFAFFPQKTISCQGTLSHTFHLARLTKRKRRKLQPIKRGDYFCPEISRRLQCASFNRALKTESSITFGKNLTPEISLLKP
ncbi:hypothetical protein CEXT_719111 [Caerostris extrusa]|uniref:Uncharacterized protein n=1 Tax=Caerostris extrusa TaxID=172846 RepID=A0AAV4U424_CAEEX|nr:hypothetical protein CEXT_719111 [Caerostris extrusa]